MQILAHNSTATMASDGVHQLGRMNSPRILTEENLKLEPLDDVVRELYFAMDTLNLVVSILSSNI